MATLINHGESLLFDSITVVYEMSVNAVEFEMEIQLCMREIINFCQDQIGWVAR